MPLFSLNSKPVTLSWIRLRLHAVQISNTEENLQTGVCFLRWKARDEKKEMDEIDFLTAYRCTLNCWGAGYESEKFTAHLRRSWTKFWKEIEGH